jgi:hypothetical protein
LFWQVVAKNPTKSIMNGMYAVFFTYLAEALLAFSDLNYDNAVKV